MVGDGSSQKGSKYEGEVNEYLSIVFLVFPVVKTASRLTNICSHCTFSQAHCPLTTIFPGFPCSKGWPCISVLTNGLQVELAMWKTVCFPNCLCPSCHWEINVMARITATLLDQVDKDYIKFDFIQTTLKLPYESWTYLPPTSLM